MSNGPGCWCFARQGVVSETAGGQVSRRYSERNSDTYPVVSHLCRSRRAGVNSCHVRFTVAALVVDVLNRFTEPLKCESVGPAEQHQGRTGIDVERYRDVYSTPIPTTLVPELKQSRSLQTGKPLGVCIGFHDG